MVAMVRQDWKGGVDKKEADVRGGGGGEGAGELGGGAKWRIGGWRVVGGET